MKRLEVSGDEGALVARHAKPNFKRLGRRMGRRMGAAAKEIQAFELETILALQEGGTVEVQGEALSADDIVIVRTARPGFVLATEGELTVALDTRITPELRSEGIARELVNRINGLRKTLEFELTDRVRVRFGTASDEVAAAIEAQGAFVAQEVLALSIERSADTGAGQQVDVEGAPVWLEVERVVG